MQSLAGGPVHGLAEQMASTIYVALPSQFEGKEKRKKEKNHRTPLLIFPPFFKTARQGGHRARACRKGRDMILQ
jgi:hypothetical protein